MSKVASIVVLLLLGAHLNLTALVPAAAGQGPPSWSVGGGLLWPFFADTSTLLPPGDLAIRHADSRDSAAACLLLAAGGLLGWLVPGSWFSWLVVAGTALSIVLQVSGSTSWTVLPLLVDAALLWTVLVMRVSVEQSSRLDQRHCSESGADAGTGVSVMASVLVAYATKYGSTREVAEAIRRETPRTWRQYRRSSRRFLSRHRTALSGVPVAVFDRVRRRSRSVGIALPDANPAMEKLPPSDLADWEAIEAWADSLPEALGLFGG